MDAKSRNSTHNQQLRFAVKPEGELDRQLDIVAYAFSPDGTLLAQSPVTDGQVALSVPADQANRARIIFGPNLRERQPSLSVLERIGYEPARRSDPKEAIQQLAPIPSLVYRPWWIRSCRVRGQVVTPSGLAVWGARVHLFEVDRLAVMIPRLPIDVLLRLRDELLRRLQEPIIIKRPWPGPDPGPLMENIREQVMGHQFGLTTPGYSMEDQVSHSLALSTNGLSANTLSSNALSTNTADANAIKANAVNANAINAAASISPTTMANLQSDSANLIQQGLLHLDQAYIMPFLCERPWFWPYLLHSDEITAVDTDQNGRFDTNITYLAWGDHPDIYFTVEYAIGGVWTTVYKRPLACDTHWNYACGSDVLLTVNDPRVVGVGPTNTVPGKAVAVLTIGNRQSVSRIQTSGAGRGLTDNNCPFGGRLEPHVWFGADVRNVATHYRWSYRRLGSSDQWRTLDTPVARHYGVMQPDNTVLFKAYSLGPSGAQALFEIQPLVAPEGGQWAPEVDARANTASAYFQSQNLGAPLATAGLYELKLELFKNGAQVNLQTAGIQFVVPTPSLVAPFGNQAVTTVPAPDVNLLKDNNNNPQAFRLILFVDNNPCTAQINPPSIGSSVVGSCGFIQYSKDAQVQISFVAGHPNNFANFDFQVHRGNGNQVQHAYGAVGPVSAASWGDYTRSADSKFSAAVAPDDLLQGCTKAAFAETLHVYALATDGWDTLTYLNRDGTPIAFAIEPAPPAQV